MSTKKKTSKDPVPDDLTYEQAMERVETITDRIESGEIGIEEAVTEYEKAMGLLKHCRAILQKAEQRITELSNDDLESTKHADN